MSTAMKIFDLASHNISNFDKSRLEIARQDSRTLVAPMNASALDIARESEARDLEIVLLVDQADSILGVFVPAEVRTRVISHLGLAPVTLTEALAEMSKMPAEIARSFRHEWLNADRPKLHWCDNGTHYTSIVPCPRHPKR